MSTIERIRAALADRYRIERELGAGGMATVYLAQDLKHDRQVAIKVLKPELAAVLGAERFVQEIKTTAALSHPHILPLFDSGEAGSFLYYVMPYIEGETIREKLNRETQLGIDEAVRITTEVADALDYAHRHGVIHRDIKPENILLHDGRAMVMDFGIALAVSAAAGGRMTETGLSLGTPHYMSPEQATADKQITARSDVYSLASVLYEMLAGEPPHTGGSAQAIIMKIIAERAKPVTEQRKSVPANVAAALAQALEKLPADRFDSAKGFAEALHDPGYGGARPPTIAVSVLPARGGQRVAMLGVALALVAIGGILGRALAPTTTSFSRVIRLQLRPPAGTRFDAFTAQVTAVSPDGEQLVVSAVDNRGGARRLYLHRLDRLEPTPIEGTERGAAPFFSPDGRSLGFISLTDGRIRRTDLGGGPVTTVSDQAANPRFAPAWGDDGAIYFTGADFRLYRVSASGGEAQRLGDTLTALTHQGELPSTFAYPVPLPGGRRLVVSECVEGILRGSTACTGGLYLMDLATGALNRLSVDGGRAWYLDGLLVVLEREGALVAVEFDEETGAVRGEPVALVGGLATSLTQRPDVAVSPGGTLAYLPLEGRLERTIVEVDRTGRERVVVAQPGPYLWVRLSPDETRLVLVADAPGTVGSQLYLFDRRSGTMAQLTFAGTNQRPSWSPDGKRIAFSSARDSVTGVWVVPADGSIPAKPIAARRDVVQQTATSWTRDGQWIVIDGLADSGGSAGADDIFALPASGEGSLQPVVATRANEQTGEVSPDGRWIAYVSDDGAFPQVYVQPFLRPGGRTLVSVGTAIEPAWLSATELVYSSMTNDSLMLARLSFGESVGVSRVALLDRSPYAVGTTAWREYDVSHDGQRFIFFRPTSGASQPDLVVVLNWLAEVRAALAARRAAR